MVIRIKKSKDFSEWEVSADNINVVYHSSGIGYKGKTPQQKVDNLIKEIKEDLKDDNVKVEYFTILPNKDEEVEEVDDPKLLDSVVEENQNEEEQIKEAEEKADIEFEKALKKITEDKNSNVIEEIYFTAKHYAKMVGLGYRKGMILYGDAGLGKSHNIIRALKEIKKDFVYMSGHITNLALFTFLYKNNNKIIVLDDVNVMDNEINLNMLKSALNDKFPIVNYNTSSSKLKVPNQFMFEGSIIILLNKKPRNNESLRAVESRVLTYELKMEYKDKIKLMKQISLLNYEGLKQEEKDIIFNWIKDNTSEATENFNLRVLFTLFEMYKYDKNNWENLAKKIIINNYEMELILQGMTTYSWCEKTGKSRATYYRYLEKLEDTKV